MAERIQRTGRQVPTTEQIRGELEGRIVLK